MRILGIEGTAHTLGIGIVEPDPDDPKRCRILSNPRTMLRPALPKPGEEAMGIHPREAAHHHSDHGPALLQQALDEAGLRADQLDGVAFSQGPGLGPCLRVAATMARALALRIEKPLIGVNHCVAHLEIGRALPDAGPAGRQAVASQTAPRMDAALEDPVLLYASGANTQVIALARGRYRVFGETIDIGIGNGLDKFARDHGFPFPGGPEVERLAGTSAAQRDGTLLELPYSVKGMDLSFAGLATAADRLVREGNDLADVCHAFQETAFAMLVEVAERALAHTGKDELLLGGGVACNARLQAMARTMAAERGARFACPPKPVLSDNGAMIAWLGLETLRSGHATPVDASEVQPYQRTDDIDVLWRRAAPPKPHAPRAGAPLAVGAEAVIIPEQLLGRDVVAKRRLAKGYRHPALDARLRAQRTRDEARLLTDARRAGVATPLVYDVDLDAATLRIERIAGRTLREALEHASPEAARAGLEAFGVQVGRLHAAGLTHGDPTTSNVLVRGPPGATGQHAALGSHPLLVLIDFGLGAMTEELEPRGVDLHLVEEALAATRDDGATLFKAFLAGYISAAGPSWQASVARLEEIRRRGRYR